MRMICKHFNFTGDYVNLGMEVGDFFCYLAEALDAEELEDYREALMAGGKEAKKKWKWSTPDHAGTRAMGGGRQDVRQSMMNMAQALTKGPVKKTGNISEIANLLGKKMVFRTEDGNYYDEDGNPVDGKGMVFIPLDNQKVN